MSKILLIADATWVANQVKTALALGEWTMEQLSDPRQTLEKVDEFSPDIVIADMQVGSMGGMAVIRAIRSEFDPAQRPRTILLLDRSADRFIARRAGADASVLKPINVVELRQALGDVPAGHGEEE